MGTLDRGENEAWLYRKGGQIPIAPIEDPTSLEWNRVMNEASDAIVSVPTGQHGECCSIYGKIGTWGCEVVMFRDGKRVWEGPVTNIKWRRGGVTLQARDVYGYTMRHPHGPRFVSTPNWVVDEGWVSFTNGFGNDNPNVLAHGLTVGNGTGPQVTRDVGAYVGYVYDQLLELTKNGLMFTSVGRRSLFWHAGVSIGQTAAVIPDKHMSGEVEIEEDGMELSVRSLFANDIGQLQAFGNTPDAFYGDVQTITSVDGATVASLLAGATTHREAHYPAPLTLNIPQGSVLSCDAPVTIDELVAGVLVPVKVEDGLCKSMIATQQLSSLKVTQDSEGEKVAVTLAPASGLVLP